MLHSSFVYVLMILQVFDILMSSSELTTKLSENTHRFRNRMSEAGFNVGVGSARTD